MVISRFKTCAVASVVVTIVVLRYCTVYGASFGETGVVIHAHTGEPIADAAVYANYLLQPQPTIVALLLSGMDHRSYSSYCVATRFTATNRNGEYKLSGLTQPQKQYSAEQAEKHKDFFRERTKRVMYKQYYKEGMERVPCENKKKAKVVCMAASKHESPEKYRPYDLEGDAARLYDLDLLGNVRCYGKHAMLFNERIYQEAKSLRVDYQDDREIYPGGSYGPTYGSYNKIHLENIRDRAYHPENTPDPDSIFEQIE